MIRFILSPSTMVECLSPQKAPTLYCGCIKGYRKEWLHLHQAVISLEKMIVFKSRGSISLYFVLGVTDGAPVKQSDITRIKNCFSRPSIKKITSLPVLIEVLLILVIL